MWGKGLHKDNKKRLFMLKKQKEKGSTSKVKGKNKKKNTRIIHVGT